MQPFDMVLRFDDSVAMSTRVDALAPIINKLILEHEAGKMLDGVETFQEKLLDRIRMCKCSEVRDIKCEHIGVHPDNREKAMLVPIDVHTLLLRVSTDGWAWSKQVVTACAIPAGLVGDEWRKKKRGAWKNQCRLARPLYCRLT